MIHLTTPRFSGGHGRRPTSSILERSTATGGPSRHSLASCRAMTLVEVIISLGLFAILSASVISITFQIRSMAEQTVYQNTALTLAQGYMEQIRHLDYTTLKQVSQDNTKTLPLDNTTGSQVQPDTGTFFGNHVWAKETIYLDQNAAGAPIQPMEFKFKADIVSLETATTGLASGVEVTITYKTTYNFGVTRTMNGALRSVRSSVPTY